MTTTPKEEPERPAPKNVIEAIARVTAEIGGIKKYTPVERKRLGMDGGGEGGISYSFRGIDQLAAAAQPLFGKYGLVLVPNVLDVSSIKIIKGGATIENTKWTRTTVEVEWSLYGPGGMEDMIRTVTVGQGDDSDEKGLPKAMTAAVKMLLLRLLMIGDPGDDTEGSTHEVGEPPDARPLGALLFEQIRDSDDPKLKALLKQFAADNHRSLTGKALIDDYDWAEKVARFIAERQQDADAEEGDIDPEAAQNSGPAETEGGGAVLTGEGEPAPPPEDAKVKLGSAAKKAAAAVNEAFPGTTEIRS